MLINIILLAIGLFALVKASDVFVDSASSFATSMRAPKTLIALTIAAFGTCAPELAISFNSIATHNYDMTLANVIGSCVVNILLIVGIATIVNPIKVKNKIIKNELPLLVITSAAFCIALNDSLFGNYKNGLSRLEAGAFVFLFGVFMLYIVLAYIKNRPKTRGRPPKAKYTPLRSTIYIIITIIVIGIASNITVDNAAELAEKIGISEKIISMTVIVIGTSLQELVMTAGAARKGEFELAVGNIIGTNIFNICIVLGLPILIFGGFESEIFNIIDSVAVLLAALTYYICSRSGKKLIRAEGVLMVSIFLCYYAYILLN